MSDERAIPVVHRNTVQVRGGGQRVITLSRDTVALIEKHRPRLVTENRSPTVQVQDRRPTVITGGTGLQGKPGAPGASIPAVQFYFGDAPRIVWTPERAGILTYARIKIEQPFNGAGAMIAVGTQADPVAAMPVDYSVPFRADEYENTPDIRLAAGKGVLLTITPGVGATAGAGMLFLDFLPD